MRDNIRLLYRLIGRFGKQPGLALFANIQRQKLSSIRIPGVKSAIALRNGTSDLETFYQVFLDQEYDITFPKNPRVIIDAGANVGLFTLLVKNKFPDAKVICVEPDSDNFPMLQMNVAGYNSVFCEHAGLWNKETNLTVSDKFNLGKWAMVVEEDPAGKVRAMSVDSIMQKYSLGHIDILKVDIETSEKHVFGRDYETWLPKVRMIVIELHDWMDADTAKPFFTAINKTFGSYKYVVKGENAIIFNKDL